MYMNSGCNPIIYAWRSPSFREGYKEILCQKSGYIVSDGMYHIIICVSVLLKLQNKIVAKSHFVGFFSTSLNLNPPGTESDYPLPLA